MRHSLGNGANMDFFMLEPVTPILTPVLSYINPDGTHPFDIRTSGTSWRRGWRWIPSSGIDIVLNGVDVTSKVTMTGATNSWSVSYPQQSTGYGDDQRDQCQWIVSVTKVFDTFNVTNFQFEANDYDFTTNGTGGLGSSFIDNPVPTCDTTAVEQGTYGADSYYGFPMGLIGIAVAQQDVDFT